MHDHPAASRRPRLHVLVHGVLPALLSLGLAACGTTPVPAEPTVAPLARSVKGEFRYKRLSDPPRTVVTDASGVWVATLTDGARTVALAGAKRTFAESAYTSATVTHHRWVRLLPAPFNGTVDEAWLKAARADTSPDVLAVASQYIVEAPAQYDAAGLRVAGDADYGPLLADGTREEGSDFNDYLGVSWAYSSGGTTTVDQPETHQIGSLDCSGFVRMVFGYRGGLPMSLGMDGASLPRRAFMQYESAPGVVTIANNGSQSTAYDRLQEGDLVFFDASTNDGAALDHVGIYLGRDSGGNYRFISSRKKANGPTLGDYGGRSILNPINGTGAYALSFRAARRL